MFSLKTENIELSSKTKYECCMMLFWHTMNLTFASQGGIHHICMHTRVNLGSARWCLVDDGLSWSHWEGFCMASSISILSLGQSCMVLQCNCWWYITYCYMVELVVLKQIKWGCFGEFLKIHPKTDMGWL